MITDSELNSIAIFLGTLMMSLIVLYHFLAVNARELSHSSVNGLTNGHGKASIVGSN